MSTIRELAMLARSRLRGEDLFKRNIRKLDTTRDEVLYNKVKQLLNEDEEVLNPIARLMDHRYYSSLSPTQKERYFFYLVDKYKLYKTEIEQDRLKIAN